MSILEENPVNATQAGEILGLGRTTMSALKRAMGIKGRYLFPSTVRKWMREHPEFKVRNIYPPKVSPGHQNNRPGLQLAAAGMSGEPPSKHG